MYLWYAGCTADFPVLYVVFNKLQGVVRGCVLYALYIRVNRVLYNTREAIQQMINTKIQHTTYTT